MLSSNFRRRASQRQVFGDLFRPLGQRCEPGLNIQLCSNLISNGGPLVLDYCVDPVATLALDHDVIADLSISRKRILSIHATAGWSASFDVSRTIPSQA